jgi:hypothetical protein
LTEVLGDEVMAVALIDRIPHHCHWSIFKRTGCAILQSPQMRKVRPALKGGCDRWSRSILSIGNAVTRNG